MEPGAGSTLGADTQQPAWIHGHPERVPNQRSSCSVSRRVARAYFQTTRIKTNRR